MEEGKNILKPNCPTQNWKQWFISKELASM